MKPFAFSVTLCIAIMTSILPSLTHTAIASSLPPKEIASQYVRGLISGDLKPFFSFNAEYRAVEAGEKSRNPKALWPQVIASLQEEVRKDLLQRRRVLALEASGLMSVDSSLFLFQPGAQASILEIRGPNKADLDLKESLERVIKGISHHMVFVRVNYPDPGKAPLAPRSPMFPGMDQRRLKEIVGVFAIVYFPADADLARGGLSGASVFSIGSTFQGISMQGNWRPGPPLEEAVLINTAKFWAPGSEVRPSLAAQLPSTHPSSAPTAQRPVQVQPTPTPQAVGSPASEVTSAIDAQADQTLQRTRPASPNELTTLRNREIQRVLALGSSAAQNIAALSQQGRLATREKNWQKCIEVYARVLGLDRDNFEALANQAGCFYELDLIDQALGRVLNAIARVPDPGLYFVAGSCYVKKRDKKRALAWLETAVKGGFNNLSMIQSNYSPYLNDPEYMTIVSSLK